MIIIPNELYEAARRSGIQSPVIARWIRNALAEAGVSPDASPAEWPEALWAAYKRLRESIEPDACGGSAKRLLEKLGDGNS